MSAQKTFMAENADFIAQLFESSCKLIEEARKALVDGLPLDPVKLMEMHMPVEDVDAYTAEALEDGRILFYVDCYDFEFSWYGDLYEDRKLCR